VDPFTGTKCSRGHDVMNYYASLVTSWNKPGLLAAARSLSIAFCPVGQGCGFKRHGHFAVVTARSTC